MNSASKHQDEYKGAQEVTLPYGNNISNKKTLGMRHNRASVPALPNQKQNIHTNIKSNANINRVNDRLPTIGKSPNQ